ncbi:MAG: HlyD family secretion protein [Candidatus Promineifilaceae bacterium]|jgi:multidrug resistance efflux pump
MKDKRTLTLIFLLMVGLLLILAACQNEEPTPTAEAVATAETSPLQETNTRAIDTGFGTVTADGKIQPLRSANLSFLLGGNIAEIMVEPGADVMEGDPLVRLDSTILENALKQAQAGQVSAEAAVQAAETQLAVAQSGIAGAEAARKQAVAQLELVKAGATQDEIAAAEKNLAAAEAGIVTAAGNRDAAVRVSDAAVQAAQAKVAAAQAEVNQLQQAYDDIIDACFKLPDGSEVCPLYGPVEENTRAQLEAAKANLTAAQSGEAEARAGVTPAEAYLAGTGITLAQAQRDQAQAQLDLILAGPRDEQIQQAQVGVDQADVGVQQAQVQVTLAEAAVEQAKAALVQAQANVEEAQKSLERMTLFAPFDGRIGDINVEIGELVGPGVPVIQFGDFGGWQVETTDLTELDIVALKLGLPVEVRVDALPGEVLTGTVTDIASVSKLNIGDVTYPVTISLDETNLPLRWGMTVEVDIDSEA